MGLNYSVKIGNKTMQRNLQLSGIYHVCFHVNLLAVIQRSLESFQAT
tara:strand:- start:919 stop:1059 length:141 start_codon:yes stop_codon:yes gene_type:complete